MIATQKYSPPKTAVSRSRTHLPSIVIATSTSYTREKVSVKLDFKLGMELKKVQKQGMQR